MGSQSANFSGLNTSSGHSPSCIIGPDAEPDSASRNDPYPNAQPLSDLGMGYMTRISADEVRFSPDSGPSNSPVYSLEPAVQNTNPSSTLAFPHYTNLYQPPLNGSTYASGGSYFSPGPSLFSMPDIKPRLGSYSSSGLAPLSRSPALPHPAAPITTRELYTGATPHLRRTSDVLARSPPLSHQSLRGVPLSPSTTSGFPSPISHMDSSLGGQASPPLFPTDVVYTLQTADGQVVKPEIFGKIDKGFFMADSDWTCYRRNYFSLNCSYTLAPSIPAGAVYLGQHGGPGPQVHGFAMSIAAVVDGRDGKAIELVQHTPKRDKGPQEKPARVTLAPRPPASHGIYGSDSLGSRAGLYDAAGFSPTPTQPAVEATFERIQFKNATANNGKRRAAQQYYHLLVELFADVGSQHPDRYVKIASRMSAPMVVRGRSPGHYQGERRGSHSSAGPGGSTGGGGGGGGGASYDPRGGHYRHGGIPPLQIPMEPPLSPEEAKSIEESSPCYLYYPGALYEGQESRFTLPSVSEYATTSKTKHECGAGAYVLPSLASTADAAYVRGCGRWEGADGSRGFFPHAMAPPEMSIT
ncbi:hypothetical protein PZA11_007575 [Diplocarpon coronariae]